MTYLDALILGLVQGITEFLPISSSGHLVLGRAVLGLEPTSDIAFEVLVHLATALAIATVYWRELWSVTVSPVVALRTRAFVPGLRLGLLLVLTSIPAAVIGLVFKDAIEASFSSVRLVGAMLLVTGTVLLLTRWAPTGARLVGPWRAVLVGFAQAAAILPGISRSGATICTAIYAGVDRDRAAEFSMLMAVPVIGGAALLKARDLMSHPPSTAAGVLILGMLAAYVAGYLSLRLLLAIVRRGRLEWFGGYCLLAGTLAILLGRG